MIRAAFWAGFGRAMAVAIGSTCVAALTLRATAADPLSVGIGALIWVVIGVICGLDAAEAARRRCDEAETRR